MSDFTDLERQEVEAIIDRVAENYLSRFNDPKTADLTHPDFRRMLAEALRARGYVLDNIKYVNGE